MLLIIYCRNLSPLLSPISLSRVSLSSLPYLLLSLCLGLDICLGKCLGICLEKCLGTCLEKCLVDNVLVSLEEDLNLQISHIKT